MCLPLAAAGTALSAFQVAGMAISAATTIAGSIAQNQAAKKQAEAIQRNQTAQMQQLQEHQRQINQQAANKESEVAREAMRQRATLQTLAGESGVSGGALDRLNAELSFRESDSISAIEQNRFNTMRQSDLQGRAMQAQAQGQLNNIDSGPGFLGTGLQILGVGADAFSKGKKMPGSNFTGILPWGN